MDENRNDNILDNPEVTDAASEAEAVEAEVTETETDAAADVSQDETEITAEDAQTETAASSDEPKYEESDNWEFEAEAMTLKNTVIEGDTLEIEIPEKPVYETRERPKAAKKETETEAPKARKDNKNITKFLLAAIAAVLIIGVLTFFGIRYYTVPNNVEKMNPGNVAMTVGDQKISVGMYNYFYNNTVNTYKSQAQYGYVDLDIYTDFAKQETTDDDGNTITWLDRFDIDTQYQLKQLAAYYEAALENGETLTEAQEEQVTTSLDSVKEAADQAGESVDAYIEETYGAYCGYNTLEKMIRMSYTAQNYLVKQSVTLKPDDAQIEAYLAEHEEDYLSANIAYLIMPYDETTKESVMAEAEGYAAQIHNLDDLKAALPLACADLIQQYVDMGYFSTAEECIAEIENEIELTVSAQTGFPEDALAWVLSDANGVGACTAIASDDNSCAIIILKESPADMPTDLLYTVRHILIMPETDADEETADGTTQAPATEEQWAAAKAKAEEVYNEYLNGEQTEANFAELAEEYSQDPGSTLEQSGVYGGIYENTAEGRMVKPFEEWSLDTSRQYGDTDIVESEYGYHIMYFVYAGPSYLAYSRTAVISDMQEEFVNAVPVKVHKSAMKYVVKATPESASTTE